MPEIPSCASFKTACTSPTGTQAALAMTSTGIQSRAASPIASAIVTYASWQVRHSSRTRG
jgi:3-dehydroquinate dehydratase